MKDSAKTVLIAGFSIFIAFILYKLLYRRFINSLKDVLCITSRNNLHSSSSSCKYNNLYIINSNDLDDNIIYDILNDNLPLDNNKNIINTNNFNNYIMNDLI